ncbi:MAG: hypothetical protein ACREUX_02145 [Burkholderiales bacterium]
MNTGNRPAVFNFEQKLAELNLSPAQRTQALDAMRAAEDMVGFLETVGTAVKRIAGVFTLKPSMRA